MKEGPTPFGGVIGRRSKLVRRPLFTCRNSLTRFGHRAGRVIQLHLARQKPHLLVPLDITEWPLGYAPRGEQRMESNHGFSCHSPEIAMVYRSSQLTMLSRHLPVLVFLFFRYYGLVATSYPHPTHMYHVHINHTEYITRLYQHATQHRSPSPKYTLILLHGKYR